MNVAAIPKDPIRDEQSCLEGEFTDSLYSPARCFTIEAFLASFEKK